MKFVCKQHPELLIHDLGVKFTDGEAEVTDPKVIAAMQKLAPELGVHKAGDAPSDEDDAKTGTRPK